MYDKGKGMGKGKCKEKGGAKGNGNGKGKTASPSWSMAAWTNEQRQAPRIQQNNWPRLRKGVLHDRGLIREYPEPPQPDSEAQSESFLFKHHTAESVSRSSYGLKAHAS